MKDINYLISKGVNIEKSLELFGDIETYNETLFEFLKNIDQRVEELRQYKEVANTADYAILVHSLKSDMRYFGFDELAEEFYKHEMESKNNNIYFIYDNYDNLIKRLQEMIGIVQEYLGCEAIKVVDDEIEVVDKETILVVDDSDIIQSFIKKTFQSKYNILTCKDGEDALRIIGNSHEYYIVAILLDLNLPNVNGFSVLNFMKQNDLFKQIPVSIITGVDDEEVVKQAFNYPIIDVLRKPFNERDVRLVIEKMLSE